MRESLLFVGFRKRVADDVYGHTALHDRDDGDVHGPGLTCRWDDAVRYIDVGCLSRTRTGTRFPAADVNSRKRAQMGAKPKAKASLSKRTQEYAGHTSILQHVMDTDIGLVKTCIGVYV